MNRRSFIAIANLAIPALLVSGCGQSEEAQDALSQLMTSLDSLEEAIEEFEDTDWKEVVPKVREAADEIRIAADDLKKSLA